MVVGVAQPLARRGADQLGQVADVEGARLAGPLRGCGRQGRVNVAHHRGCIFFLLLILLALPLAVSVPVQAPACWSVATVGASVGGAAVGSAAPPQATINAAIIRIRDPTKQKRFYHS